MNSLTSAPKTIRWSVCEENEIVSLHFRVEGIFPCKISGIKVRIGKVLPDSWQDFPVHDLKMCVYSRESSYFRFTLEKCSGDENRNLAIKLCSLCNAKVCHVNTDRNSVYLLLEKKDMKLMLTPIVLL